MPSGYNDYPVDVIVESMTRQVKRGAVTFMKWTCAGCGERVTANEPDKVYLTAQHEERSDGSSCGAITDVQKQGCNFMFVLKVGRS